MSMIERIRDYVLTYPQLPDGAVQIDYLGAEAGQFTLEAVPCDPVYRRYTDGGCIRQYLFVFASRSYYGADVALCAENQALFEGLSRWIRENDRQGALPVLDEGCTAERLDVLSSGYVLSEDTESARYQMQLRLIYTDNE
jgi:hypothetical protein